MARCGKVGSGRARQARLGEVWRGGDRTGLAGVVVLGPFRHGAARLGRRGQDWWGTARIGLAASERMAWLGGAGKVWRGVSWRDVDGPGVAGEDGLGGASWVEAGQVWRGTSMHGGARGGVTC